MKPLVLITILLFAGALLLAGCAPRAAGPGSVAAPPTPPAAAPAQPPPSQPTPLTIEDLQGRLAVSNLRITNDPQPMVQLTLENLLDEEELEFELATNWVDVHDNVVEQSSWRRVVLPPNTRHQYLAVTEGKRVHWAKVYIREVLR